MLELIRKCSKEYQKSRRQPHPAAAQGKNAKHSNTNSDVAGGEHCIGKMTSNQKKSKPISSNWVAFKASGALEAEIKRSAKRKSIDSSTVSKRSHSLTHKVNENSSGVSESPDTSECKDSLSFDSKTKEEKKMLANCVALDCEMVGVHDGNESVLARVSIVNHDGECIYDKFVKPKENVVDYRTHVSGVRPSDLKNAEAFEVVQKEVAAMLKGRILVGHALKNDLKVLLLSHPPTMIRDTSGFKLFRDIANGRNPSLKKLASEILGVTIQSGEHSSVEDARAAMQLYNLYQKEWENQKAKKKAQRKDAALNLLGPIPSFGKTSKKPSKNPLMDEFTAF